MQIAILIISIVTMIISIFCVLNTMYIVGREAQKQKTMKDMKAGIDMCAKLAKLSADIEEAMKGITDDE